MENRELIRRAICFSKGNALRSDITLTEVAAAAGFTSDYFNRIFLAHTGFTVMAYINYLRQKEAAILLRESEKSILEIALEVGYDSHEGFSKAFKKVYGTLPSEYRKCEAGITPGYKEMTDKTTAAQFLYENPDLIPVDTEQIIDRLMEKDAKRYARFCAGIKTMGMTVAVPKEEPERGIIAIGDDLRGGVMLEAISDDMQLIAEWIRRFPCQFCFYGGMTAEKAAELLGKYGTEVLLKGIPQLICQKEAVESGLPGKITVKKLTYSDQKAVLCWANGKKDGYIRHLLREKDYEDERTLEYGVFEGDKLIAIAGCGVELIRGMRFNDCIVIRFAEGKEQQVLQRPIFLHVVNELINNGILPFDTIQHGEYAKTHGGFTAEEAGFTVMDYKIQVIR
ncbi:MAG: helix-turn-helix transcriptional regulator [Ruminococcaceae bacterium]|nr:helix-turn-helix transcriptional regulator [Oscillospiraceae bacterium]